jgi:biopolymer transport protein ExbD
MLVKPFLTGQRNRPKKPVELLLVPMIDIFTVLVTFLLMTAVFSRITIIQLDLPSSAAASPSEPDFRLEVIVRKEGFELTNGRELIAAIPTVNGEYDMKALTEMALALKREHPQTETASVLMERGVNYDYLIRAMDAIRDTQLPGDGAGAHPMKVALFPKIAVGDAPEEDAPVGDKP